MYSLYYESNPNGFQFLKQTSSVIIKIFFLFTNNKMSSCDTLRYLELNIRFYVNCLFTKTEMQVWSFWYEKTAIQI